MATARSRNEFRLVSARPNLLFSLHVGMSANNGLAKLFGILVVPPAPTGWPGNLCCGIFPGLCSSIPIHVRYS